MNSSKWDSLEDEPERERCEVKRKLAFKQIALGLNRLIENGIALHIKKLKESLDRLQKCVDPEEREIIQSTVKQVLTLLAQDLSQIDCMRKSVREEELNKFDNAAERTRHDIHDAISDAKKVISTSLKPNVCSETDSDPLEQRENEIMALRTIQLQQDKMETDNEILLEKADAVQNLAKDLCDLKEIMVLLNQNVAEQGEAVEAIECHVETALENVSRGQVLLAQARHLKTASLPIVGMTVGLAVGGPVGAVAGAQIGLLTSVVGGALGFAGGKIAHQMNRFTKIASPPKIPIPNSLESKLRIHFLA